MRIIHIITKFHEMYGAQRHAVECMKNHLQNGHECLAIAGTDGEASNEVKRLGINVFTIPTIQNAYNLFIDRKAIASIRLIINNFKPDLVISHSSKAGVLSRIACYQTKTPNIFTVHGWPFENGTPFLQKTVSLLIERILIPFSDSYVCVSNYTKDFGLSKLPLNKSRVYACPNMHEKKEQLPLENKQLKHNVLMVGGFRAQKDHLTALKALKIIVYGKKTPSIHFTFVGDGPKRGVIEKFIIDNQLTAFVSLVGETKAIETYYKDADIVILPTYYEGLPLSLIEALQNGLPVIATNTGGISEIVFDNKNGNLIQLEDDIALAANITDYYLNNKIEQLSKNAREVYETHYSYDIISKKLNDLIVEALNNSVFTKQNTEVRHFAYSSHN